MLLCMVCGTDVTVPIIYSVDNLLLQFWDGEQKFIPDVREIVFSNIPVEGRVIHPNVHRFFDGFGQAIIFSSNYSKIIQGCCMATIVLM